MKKIYLKFMALALLSVLSVTNAWAYNEYWKKYLYVDATACSWYEGDGCKPFIVIYDEYGCNTEKATSDSPGSTSTTRVWYFDLSSFYAYWEYSRGFKVERHTGSWWGNPVKSGYVDGDDHNCFEINSNSDGMSWTYYAVPISSIALDASNNILSGSGTSLDPYIVPVGKSVTLTADPSFTPADPTMQFCANFGTSPSSNPTTVQSSSTYTVTSTSKTELKCIGRNKYKTAYSADVTSSSVYVQGIEPSVGVSAAGSITTDEATLNATVTVNGATTTAYGFKYGTSSDRATLISSGTTASTSGALAANATSFSKGVSSLTANTTYYYVSFVTTASGTYYSASTQSFTTLDDSEPTHNVKIYYKYSSTDIKSYTTLDVGESTPSNVSSASITGYTFSSWSLGDGLTNESGSTGADPISITTKSSGTYTLTANYNINSYNVTFNANGGSGSMSAESFNYNQTKALTSNAYTRDGYVFKGWATSSANATAGTVAYADGANYTIGSANVTLYAVWYKKAFFVNVPKWSSSNVKAHVYKGEDGYKTWNSSDEEMTSTGTSVFGYTIYSYEFPENYTTVIFHNNGNNQTDPWTWSSSNYYYHGASTQYASVAAIRQAWKIGGSWDVDNGDWVVNDFTSYDTDDATYTVTLAASTSYQFKFTFTGTNSWYGQTSTGNMSDGDTWTLNGGNTVNFTSTIAGTYTFTIDYSDISSNSAPDCTLDFPVSYTVNFGVSPAAAADDPTNDQSISSGDLVPTGATITFTKAESPNPGYTWSHWEKNSSNVGTGNTYEATITGNTTVTAVYTEDKHTVTLVAGDHGSITTPASGTPRTVSVGIATGATIAATAAEGYVFSRWTVTSGDASDVTIADDESASTTVTATGDVTLTATFISAWAITGSSATFGNWSTTAHGFDHFGTNTSSKDTCWIEFTLPANTDFTFKLYNHLGTGDKWYGNSTISTNYMTYAENNDQNWEFHEGNSYKDCGITTAGAGTYRFIWNITDEMLRVRFPESYTVTYGKVVNNGQNIGGVTATGDDDDALANGKYVAKGSATFTAAEAANYSFVDWRTSDTYGDGTQLSTDNPYTMSSISANKTVYAHYAENMTTIALTNNGHGHVEISGVEETSTTAGVYTTRSITAVPDAGYYFSGWEVIEGSDFSVAGTGEADATTTLTGGGNGETSGQTLKANFTELSKIYFRDVFDDGAGNVTHWGDVYAYFGITWNGYNQAVTNSSHNDWRVHMTQIDRTDVWWAYVPRNFTTAAAGTKEKVGFASNNDNMDGCEYTFYNCNAATRGDYSNLLNMFVPYHVAKTTGNNSVDYYDNGYWMRYDTRADQGAGYYLKSYNKRNDYTQEGEFIATNDDATAIQFTYRIDATTPTTFKFMIVSAGGLNYLASSAISSGTNSGIEVNENTQELKDYDVYFTLTSTSEGDYTFVLDQNSDKMKLSVIYPIEVGDYRLVHTYNVVSNLTGEKDSLVYNLSDVIKKSEISGKTVSMYLNMAEGTKALKLAKCTEISDGTPVWGSSTTVGTGTGFFNTTTFNKGAGVYKFDITISSHAISSITNVGLYDGPYYIKTNSAPGGWANYKKNVLEENTVSFVKTDPSTYDYYFCKWIGSSGTNVKCVIANDYNNYLSDTLLGDGIIGRAAETLPAAGSVRFSYNTATNQLKRAYLSGSSDPNDRFLLIHCNDKMFTSSGGDIDYSGTYDNLDEGEAYFSDKNNWTYEVDLKANSGAAVYLTAAYNGADRDLYGSSSEQKSVLTSSNTTTKYDISVIYDFKTNHLMTAWRPGTEPIVDEISGAPAIMIVRTHQEGAESISFGTNQETSKEGKIGETRVYGTMHFNRWTLNNKSTEGAHAALTGDDIKSDYELGLYWISFPFDVKLSDVFGFGTYFEHWVIEYYDGIARAREGYWADSEGFWKYVTSAQRDNGYILKANVGYVLALDLDKLKWISEENHSTIWNNSVEDIYLYFPSDGTVETIQNVSSKDITIEQDGYKCNIGPRFEGGDDRRIKDSYWHILGVPSFKQVSHATSTSDVPSSLDEGVEEWTPGTTLYFYKWDPEENTYEIQTSGTETFKAMHSYMVQYSSTSMTWNLITNNPPAAVAARVKETPDKDYNLALIRDNKEEDHTLLRLTDDENVTSRFEFNYDICKEYNGGRGNIWTVTADTVQVAGNSMPKPLQTTIVPVGVKIAANGEYTFSMPEGTNGGDVWLIDNANSSRTNLGLMDYTVNLTAGTYEGRFSLEFPVQNVVTEIENAANANANANADDAVRKVFVGGQLYIIRDGVIYNASGARVQ